MTVGHIVATTIPSYSFDSPTGSRVWNNHPPSGYSHVTVTGLNFAQLDVTSTVGQPLVNVAVGDCSSASWTSSSSITCQQNSDENQKLAHEHIVQIASRIGTSLPIFSMDSPVVSHVMHNAPYVGHTLLTYMGLQFGGYNFTLTSALAAGATATKANCFTTAWTTSSTVVCDSNPVYDVTRTVSITVSAFVSTGQPIFTYDGPMYTTVTRNTPLCCGALLTMSGLIFGSTGAHGHVCAHMLGQMCECVRRICV